MLLAWPVAWEKQAVPFSRPLSRAEEGGPLWP